MTDYLTNAVDWLVTTLEDNASQSITLTDGGLNIPLTGIVTSETIDRRQDSTGLVIAYVREATVGANAIASLSGTEPKVGMTVVIGGQTYDVENVNTSSEHITMSLVRYQVRERTRPDYRRR